MDQKYLLKTESGNYYEVIDETHLFGQDTWIILKNNVRNIIIAVGKLRERVPGPLGGAIPLQTQKYFKQLDGEIKNAFVNGKCVGQVILYVPEQLLAPHLKTKTISKEEWTRITSNSMGNTSTVIEVYKKIH